MAHFCYKKRTRVGTRGVAFLMLLFAWTLPAFAGDDTWQKLTSHLFTNCPIVWQAPISELPKNFWIYQRSLPNIFSATVITNAIVLGSLQSKGFPQPSTNVTCITDEPQSQCVNVCNFYIDPNDASMNFISPGYKNASPYGIPSDATIIERTWDCVPQLGLDPKQLIQKSFFTHSSNVDKDGDDTTNFISGRGLFLARQLDGVDFFSADNTGGGAEGFSIEFGSHGEVRCFSLQWSEFTRYSKQKTASVPEMIQGIRAHLDLVLPKGDEENYFARLKTLATAKRLTITKITPYYGNGVFGQVPTNYVPCKFATPFAELEAVAAIGNSDATLRLLSPILSSEVNRLTGTK